MGIYRKRKNGEVQRDLVSLWDDSLLTYSHMNFVMWKGRDHWNKNYGIMLLMLLECILRPSKGVIIFSFGIHPRGPLLSTSPTSKGSKRVKNRPILKHEKKLDSLQKELSQAPLFYSRFHPPLDPMDPRHLKVVGSTVSEIIVSEKLSVWSVTFDSTNFKWP